MAVEGEGQIAEAPVGEVAPAVQGGEIDTSSLEAPAGSEEPTSSQAQIGELPAGEAQEG